MDDRTFKVRVVHLDEDDGERRPRWSPEVRALAFAGVLVATTILAAVFKW